MLGAPMWTRLSNLRLEANLPSLENRVRIRNSCIMTKSLVSSRESHTKRKALIELNKNRDIQNYSTYSKHLTDCAKDLKLTETLLSLKSDVPNNNVNIPPWESIGTSYSYTQLPRAKEQCSPLELQNAAILAINTAERAGNTVYYTDGTVDPDTNTTGAAVFSNNFTGCWRTSDSASTMQTELIAIKQALTHSLENEVGPVTIHTDCKSAVQALQMTKVKENKSIIKDIQHLLYQHKTTNRHVSINWIPSHIGIHGNDKADELAKTTKYIENVQIKIQPTISQIKLKIAPAIKTKMQEEVKNQVSLGSQSSFWYKHATDLLPHPVAKDMSRKLAVTIHRLRLGYKANWQIIQGNNRPCNYCDETPDSPLLHYLLECPHTASLRGNQVLPIIQDPNSTLAAAKLSKDIIEDINIHYNLLMDSPPPR